MGRDVSRGKTTFPQTVSTDHRWAPSVAGGHRYDPSVTICRCPLMGPMCGQTCGQTTGTRTRASVPEQFVDRCLLFAGGWPASSGRFRGVLWGLRPCLTSFWLPVPVVAGLPDVAGRAGLPGGAAGRVTRLEALRTFSEHFPNIFRTLSNIVGGTPRPREGQGRGHPPVPNIFRTFPEHVPVGSFIALAQRARAPTSSEHFPNIFRTLSGNSLARARAGE